MAHIPRVLAPKLTASEKATLINHARRTRAGVDGDVTVLVQLRLLSKDMRTNAYHLTPLGRAVVDEIACQGSA
ncbi:MAG: hypothetical protein AAFN63_16400 [Pseudomonadota bacterium]